MLIKRDILLCFVRYSPLIWIVESCAMESSIIIEKVTLIFLELEKLLYFGRYNSSHIYIFKACELQAEKASKSQATYLTEYRIVIAENTQIYLIILST